MDIKYKFKRLLTESYNFTNADEVYEALKANQIGVKILPEYKEKTKWDYTCEKLKIFFRKCEEMGIKDTTYGVQLLLSKCDPYNLENILRSDGFYELLKSRKKPWVKELPEYKKLMDEKIWLGAHLDEIHALEKAIQKGQTSHGKMAKGNGDKNGVKTLYDDGTWRLLVPTSFEAEKAAAYYIDKENGKEEVTNWCTRVGKDYYEAYTKNGPLYIIRNMKNGNSYQIAFGDSVDYNRISFMDQYDDDESDPITLGDLKSIPDELLKLIKDPRTKDGKTLYDFKHEGVPKPTFKRGRVSSRDVANNPMRAKYGPEEEVKDGVCRKRILNYSFDVHKENNFKAFFNMEDGKYKPLPEKFGKKDKAYIYYLKNKPEAKMALETSVYGNTRKIGGAIYQSKQYQELPNDEQYKIEKIAFEDFGYKKNEEREKQNSNKKYVDDFNIAVKNKYNDIIEAVNNSGVFEGSPFKELVNIRCPSYIYHDGTIDNRVSGDTIPSYLELLTRKGKKVELFFYEKGKYENAAVTSDYSKSIGVRVIGDNTFREDTGEVYKFAKKVAREVMKYIIKMPEYKVVNQARRNWRWNRDYKHGTTRQERRDIDNFQRKEANERFDFPKDEYVHQEFHPPIHEEVNYFPY